MAVLTYAARIDYAKELLSRTLHLAIGKGKAEWEDIPEKAEYEAVALVNEIGRKVLTRKFFVNEDDDGAITMPGGRKYSVSETPTRHLFLSCDFDYGEGVAEPIREVGIFKDTQLKSGFSGLREFFTPDKIQSSGTMIMLEHLTTTDIFTPTRKGTYSTVLTI